MKMPMTGEGSTCRSGKQTRGASVAYATFAELCGAAEECGSLGAAVLEQETFESEVAPDELRASVSESLAVMRAAIKRGLSGDARSQSGLIGGDSAKIAAVIGEKSIVGGLFPTTLAYALATVEVNASMGRIVAAPTGGASGVLPGVIFSIGEHIGADDDVLIDAILAAGGVGSVIAAKATLSGAAGGCQAEVGSASAMAAGAAVQMLGGSPQASGHAASLALQGQLGLVCDPVCGLVEVPCVVRNATGASVALSAVEMAMAGVEFPIPFDEVVDAMAMVGRSMSPALRETAYGGLAITATAKKICSDLSM